MQRDFSLEALALEIVRERGGRTVHTVVRELDRRIPDGPAAREAYLQALEIVVRDVVRRMGEHPPVAGRVIESRPAAPEGYCEMYDLPVYACAHCTGRNGYEADLPDEMTVGRELRERIEAGLSRERAAEEVLALIPGADGMLRSAARAALLHRATQIERMIARETERAALGRGERVTSLERAAAAVRLADVEFKLSDGQPVAWGRATRAQHLARAAWSRAMQARHGADAGVHEKAVALLDGHGARCLDDIPGWEGEMGQLPAAAEAIAG